MRTITTHPFLLGALVVAVTAALAGFAWSLLRPCVADACDVRFASPAAARPTTQSLAPVVISGRTTAPVVPGVSVPLNLRFENPNRFVVTTGRLRVAIGAVRAPRSTSTHTCTVRDFMVQQARAGLAVTLGSRERTSLGTRNVRRMSWPRVAMRNLSTNQDGCQGASLTLRYSSYGVQVRP